MNNDKRPCGKEKMQQKLGNYNEGSAKSQKFGDKIVQEQENKGGKARRKIEIHVDKYKRRERPNLSEEITRWRENSRKNCVFSGRKGK